MATGTGQEQQGEATVPAADGRFEVAHAPLEEPDFSQAFPSLKERWANFDQDIKKFWDSTRNSRQSGTEVLSFPPLEPDVSRPKEPTKPLDPTKPKLPLLSINQMVEIFPDLKSLVFGNTTTYPDLKVDIPNSDRDFRAQYVKSIQEMSRNHGLSDKQVQEAIVAIDFVFGLIFIVIALIVFAALFFTRNRNTPDVPESIINPAPNTRKAEPVAKPAIPAPSAPKKPKRPRLIQ